MIQGRTSRLTQKREDAAGPSTNKQPPTQTNQPTKHRKAHQQPKTSNHRPTAALQAPSAPELVEREQLREWRKRIKCRPQGGGGRAPKHDPKPTANKHQPPTEGRDGLHRYCTMCNRGEESYVGNSMSSNHDKKDYDSLQDLVPPITSVTGGGRVARARTKADNPTSNTTKPKTQQQQTGNPATLHLPPLKPHRRAVRG